MFNAKNVFLHVCRYLQKTAEDLRTVDPWGMSSVQPEAQTAAAIQDILTEVSEQHPFWVQESKKEHVRWSVPFGKQPLGNMKKRYLSDRQKALPSRGKTDNEMKAEIIHNLLENCPEGGYTPDLMLASPWFKEQHPPEGEEPRTLATLFKSYSWGDGASVLSIIRGWLKKQAKMKSPSFALTANGRWVPAGSFAPVGLTQEQQRQELYVAQRMKEKLERLHEPLDMKKRYLSDQQEAMSSQRKRKRGRT